MKTYWHFDRNGNFLRTVNFLTDDAPDMLALDGKPRNVLVIDKPEHDPQTEYATPGRTGWEVKTHPLTIVKANALSTIETELRERLARGVVIGNNTFGAEANDQSAWIAATTSLSLAERIAGTDISNLPAYEILGPILGQNGLPINPQPTVAECRAIIYKIAKAIAALRMKAAQLITAIQAAQNASDICAVKWID
jgi:hypothetical protein